MDASKQDSRQQLEPIKFTGTLAKTVFNSLSANIAIIDAQGVVLETNRAWKKYATANQMQGANEVEWVRAGHEPTIFYDPATSDFIELATSGMALGVDKDYRHEKKQKADVQEGSIIVIGTDGVWQTRNKSGQMLGREAVCDTIRNNLTAAK